MFEKESFVSPPDLFFADLVGKHGFGSLCAERGVQHVSTVHSYL